MVKVNIQKELRFLKQCETNAHTAISAKQRFIELLYLLPHIPKPKNILDVGGNFATAKWLQVKFPKSTVTILNKSDKELASYPNFIKADAQFFKTKEKYDLIFSGETIEHTYNPDGLLACSLLALKPGGYFIITTPNLSCLYNRIFLLLGWSPANYSPSLRYKTGNPLLKIKSDGFGFTGDHKSVFTWQAFRQLLEKYGFKISYARGFCYGQEGKIQIIGKRYIERPYVKFRLLVNHFLPHSLKEGMMFICRAPNKINRRQALKGILKKDLWEY